MKIENFPLASCENLSELIKFSRSFPYAASYRKWIHVWMFLGKIKFTSFKGGYGTLCDLNSYFHGFHVMIVINILCLMKIYNGNRGGREVGAL